MSVIVNDGATIAQSLSAKNVALTGDGRSPMILPVRTALRFVMCLAIFGSLGLVAIPTRMAAEQIKIGCCAKMKKEAAEPKDCGQHAPKSNEDKQCCSLCVICLATLASTATPFVYPPTGEETFAAFINREHARSHRPPVPPPRAV